MHEPIWTEINLNAIRHNIKEVFAQSGCDLGMTKQRS